MQDLCVPRFRLVSDNLNRRSHRHVASAALLLAVGLGWSCVDLTPPPSVVNYRRAKGGASAGSSGSGAGGNVGSGGSATAGAAGGSAGGTAGGTSSGSGGAPSSDGPIPPDQGGASDVAPGAGGAAGVSGTGGRDAASSGGVGGGPRDASETAPGDVPMENGGAGGSATGGTTSGAGGVGAGGTTSATGGTTGSGGSPGAGGVTATGGKPTYNCASASSPDSGLITDFTDWDATAGVWRTGALTGNIYQYGSSGTTMNAAKVEGSPAGLHLSGSLSSGYAGGGLTFYSCLKVTSYTKVSFDVYGSAAGCAIELQLQTYEQRPAEQTPPGGCKSDGGSSCFKFPAKSQIVSASTLGAAPGKTVTETLTNFTNWSTAAAGQIVGMQWQFTTSGGTCTPNVTFTNVKFLP